MECFPFGCRCSVYVRLLMMRRWSAGLGFAAGRLVRRYIAGLSDRRSSCGVRDADRSRRRLATATVHFRPPLVGLPRPRHPRTTCHSLYGLVSHTRFFYRATHTQRTCIARYLAYAVSVLTSVRLSHAGVLSSNQRKTVSEILMNI